MNGKGARISVVIGFLVGLVLAACGEPDVIASYCNRYNYCFTDYDYVGCMEDRETMEELAFGQGDTCHAAFGKFHECIGELSCSDLDDYLADNSHCGSAFNAWQSRCPGN